MKRRNTILFTLLLAGLVPFAIRGCAAMLFVTVPAPVVGEERNFDITRPQTKASAAPAPTGAVGDARTRYTQAEKAVENFVRSLGKKARSDADRSALRNLVAKAFEQRQELLRLELAEFQSRMNRLSQQLAERAEGREKVIDRRVDELLMPNLRWEESPAEPAAQAPKIEKVAEIDLEPSNKEPLSRDDRKLLSLRKRVAFASELQGLWLAMEQGRNGEMTPFKTNFTLTFNEKQQYAFREGDAQPYSLGTYSLPEVASGLPFAALDLTRTYLRQAGGPNPFGNPDQTQIEHAIVAIEGDTLRICSGGQRMDDRPNDFTTAKDDGRLLMVYRRVSRKPLGDNDVPVTGPSELHPGGSGPPPGDGPPETKKPVPADPLRPIEPPLPEGKTAAEELKKVFGFELEEVTGEAIGIPPFRGGLQIVSIREKSLAALTGLQKDDILIGAHVWETLTIAHLQFAVDRYRDAHKDPNAFASSLRLHLLRERSPFRERLTFSVQVPLPAPVAPKEDSSGAAEPSPKYKSGDLEPKKPSEGSVEGSAEGK